MDSIYSRIGRYAMGRLDKWKVATDETALFGATSALLSVSDMGVILDSPLWCSALTSRKVQMIRPSWEKRLYSTLIEENDLVFGAKKKLIHTTQTMLADEKYSCIAAVLNCGPALVGDDVTGIIESVTNSPVITVDAGGFTGEVDQGYSDAMISILNIIPSFSDQKKDKKNLLGMAIYDTRNVSCDEYLFMPGYKEMSFSDISKLTEATENVVVHPRGLAMAKWLHDKYEQKFVLAY